MRIVVSLSSVGIVGVVLLPLKAVVVLPHDVGDMVGPVVVDPEPVTSECVPVHKATVVPGGRQPAGDHVPGGVP